MSRSSSSSSLQTEAEAFAFRKLIEHLKWRNETIQNIEMMNLTGFCRNCVAKWLLLGKKNVRLKSTYESCQEEVYGLDGGPFLKITKRFCPVNNLISITRFFGCGTFVTIMTLIIYTYNK